MGGIEDVEEPAAASAPLAVVLINQGQGQIHRAVKGRLEEKTDKAHEHGAAAVVACQIKQDHGDNAHGAVVEFQDFGENGRGDEEQHGISLLPFSVSVQDFFHSDDGRRTESHFKEHILVIPIKNLPEKAQVEGHFGDKGEEHEALNLFFPVPAEQNSLDEEEAKNGKGDAACQDTDGGEEARHRDAREDGNPPIVHHIGRRKAQAI